MKEYTDLEIMQMIGRAVSFSYFPFARLLIFVQGRPQFGKRLHDPGYYHAIVAQP